MTHAIFLKIAKDLEILVWEAEIYYELLSCTNRTHKTHASILSKYLLGSYKIIR